MVGMLAFRGRFFATGCTSHLLGAEGPHVLVPGGDFLEALSTSNRAEVGEELWVTESLR